MIRAFIAVSLDAEVVANIAGVGARLSSEIIGVRWIAPANFHLTLKFLGPVEEELIEPCGAALHGELRLFPRFTINAKGLGVFPGPKRPRVLWVGLTGDRIFSLVSRVESALQPLGFAPEARTFTPHLTIGRWRETDRAPKSLGPQLAKWQTHDFGASKVESVKLIQSLLSPQGASYKILMTVPLKECDR